MKAKKKIVFVSRYQHIADVCLAAVAIMIS